MTSSQSCPTLCHPVDCSPPSSTVYGILQARVLKWAAMLCSRGPSWPRDWRWSLSLFSLLRWRVGPLQLMPPGKPSVYFFCIIFHYRLLQDTRYSFLCYAACPCYLFDIHNVYFNSRLLPSFFFLFSKQVKEFKCHWTDFAFFFFTFCTWWSIPQTFWYLMLIILTLQLKLWYCVRNWTFTSIDYVLNFGIER